MADLPFLPAWPTRDHGLLWAALLLLGAVCAGEAAQRLAGLPRIVGYLAAGALLGPNASGLVPAPVLASLRPLLEVAVGIVLFELGQRVDPLWLVRNPWLLAASILEAALSFAAVFGVLLALDADPLLAAVAASISMAAAPAEVLSITRELRAQGQVSERLVLFSALNCTYAVIATTTLLAWLNLEYRGGWQLIVLQPLYLLAGSVLLAMAFAAALLCLLERLGRRREAQFACTFALVVIAVALASAFRLSVLLTLLAFGMLARAMDHERHFGATDFGRVGMLFTVVLFVLSGALLQLSLEWASVWAALALAAARIAGKAVALVALARPSGMLLRKSGLLALALAPMSGVAAILVQDTAALFPELAPSLAAVMLTALALFAVLGPLATQYALRSAGEATTPGAERP